MDFEFPQESAFSSGDRQTSQEQFQPGESVPKDFLTTMGVLESGEPRAGNNRISITMDNIETQDLFAVMSILVRSKANVKLEMGQ